MYVMIDNYDSFVYNLAIYFEELGHEIRVVRNDGVDLEELEALTEKRTLEGIILSPGPKGPWDCGSCREILEQFAGRVPILGVCLGHQIIGYGYGARVEKGQRPMHGKVCKVYHQGENLFAGLPSPYEITRYHSLVVKEESLPPQLQVDARTEDGAVMALSHRTLPVYGVQFHPEAVLTQYGHELLENFCRICGVFWEKKGV